jgi:hypothetical protein
VSTNIKKELNLNNSTEEINKLVTQLINLSEDEY